MIFIKFIINIVTFTHPKTLQLLYFIIFMYVCKFPLFLVKFLKKTSRKSIDVYVYKKENDKKNKASGNLEEKNIRIVLFVL